MNDVVQVVIVDCEKAGLIGGPFQVVVIKNGKQVASHSGLRSLGRAEQVRDELQKVYGPLPNLLRKQAG